MNMNILDLEDTIDNTIKELGNLRGRNDIESVEMRGQRLAIRIITSEYLREHKLVKYKYEVLSKGSKYFGNVDLIYSTHDMRAGHHYKISVNRNTSNPRVLNVLRELER